MHRLTASTRRRNRATAAQNNSRHEETEREREREKVRCSEQERELLEKANCSSHNCSLATYRATDTDSVIAHAPCTLSLSLAFDVQGFCPVCRFAQKGSRQFTGTNVSSDSFFSLPLSLSLSVPFLLFLLE